MVHSKSVKTAVIMGNGPSLRGFNFPEELKNIDTFGMNAAYRYWNDINWYPTYYSCLDAAVGECHKEEIARLIQNQKINGIKKFILRANVHRYLVKSNIINDSVINFDFWQLRNHFTSLFKEVPTTGSYTAFWAATLGYKTLILIGIDANFPVEKLNEAKISEDQKCPVKSGIQQVTLLELTDTPKENKNYFFDSYQQKGDFYYMTDKNKLTENQFHLNSWKFMLDVKNKYNIDIINANPESKIPFFQKYTWNESKKRYIQRNYAS